jgi:hypothetical protein
MNVRRNGARLTALIVVAAMPLMGLSGIASAKATKGSAAWCAKHAKKAACKAGGAGATGSGSGGAAPLITVEVDPNPLVETGQSEVTAVVQVETNPQYAGDLVNIDSSQLEQACASLDFDTVNFATNQFDVTSPNNIEVALDDDGNVTVGMKGIDCAPGTDVVEADLDVAPFLTALTTLTVNPPVVTPEGLTGYPQTAGQAEEVETGDTSTSGDSDVYAVFYVETSPVYAEQLVEIESPQLEASCLTGWVWIPGNQDGVGPGGETGSGSVFGKGFDINGFSAATILDDDGNAVFMFKGTSCAASNSEVIADVLAGSHPTYVTSWTTEPPAPTI